MTVHVLMPVFNRLAMTQNMVEALRRQVCREAIKVLVIDDGSSDGTAEYLRDQGDLRVLQGDGSLWWGGAIDLGVRQLFATSEEGDWLLMVNNDTTLAPDFVQTLLNAAEQHAPAVVGSVVRDEAEGHSLLSLGARIDPWRLTVTDHLGQGGNEQAPQIDSVIDVDAISGRGALFPMAAVRAVGGMRPRFLPHYLADYELSVRIRRQGWRLLVARDGVVYSKNEFGNSARPASLWRRLLSRRSPDYLPALLLFWWGASNWPQRLTLPLRLPILALLPGLRRAPK